MGYVIIINVIAIALKTGNLPGNLSEGNADVVWMQIKLSRDIDVLAVLGF